MDQQRAYSVDAGSLDSRIAFYAFPGLVFGFYAYYWLRAGHWAAFFDGRWTTQASDAAAWFGPGLFFAPAVPAVWAALLTLVAASALSFTIFSSIERFFRARGQEPRVLGHRLRAVAAFIAFNVFYCFAGAPTLRWIPGAERVVPFVAAVVATLVLARRNALAPAALAAPESARVRLKLVSPTMQLARGVAGVRS